jgi:hypothetical protein
MEMDWVLAVIATFALAEAAVVDASVTLPTMSAADVLVSSLGCVNLDTTVRAQCNDGA